MKNKKFNLFHFIEENFNNSFNYVKDSRKFIYSIILVFFFFALVGFFVPLPPEISKELLDYFRKIIEETKGFGLFDLIIFLFRNNSLSGFMGLFFGVILGIFPVINAIINGLVLGFVSNLSVTKNGAISLWRLFPHGIFELPAIFISLGLGVKLSTFIFKKDKLNSLINFLEKSFWSFLLIVVPLLILAAIIEGTLIYLGF